MNLFILDEDPVQAARDHCDKHVVKMTTETMQMLLNPYIYASIPVPFVNCSGCPYSISHFNHPCSLWIRQTRENYVWACILGIELCREYTRRYNKRHRTQDVIKWCTENRGLLKLPSGARTPFPVVMPGDYTKETAVESYRNYYSKGKAMIARWNHSTVPFWWPKNEIPAYLVA